MVKAHCIGPYATGSNMNHISELFIAMSTFTLYLRSAAHFSQYVVTIVILRLNGYFSNDFLLMH